MKLYDVVSVDDLLECHRMSCCFMQHSVLCVDADYWSLSSDCVSKRAAVRQLKLQLLQLEAQMSNSHQRIDDLVQQLVVSLLCSSLCSVSLVLLGEYIPSSASATADVGSH